MNTPTSAAYCPVRPARRPADAQPQLSRVGVSEASTWMRDYQPRRRHRQAPPQRTVAECTVSLDRWATKPNTQSTALRVRIAMRSWGHCVDPAAVRETTMTANEWIIHRANLRPKANFKGVETLYQSRGTEHNEEGDRVKASLDKPAAAGGSNVIYDNN